MEIIRIYAGFSLAASVALLLLPEGSLRRTASLAVGLLSALLWLRGLEGFFALPDMSVASVSVLTAVETPGNASPDVYAQALSLIASEAAGCEVAVALQADGSIGEVRMQSQDPAARQLAAEALGIDPSQVTDTGVR